MQRFVTERGKILPRRISGMCARHQRQVGTAVKRARYLALLPYIALPLGLVLLIATFVLVAMRRARR